MPTTNTNQKSLPSNFYSRHMADIWIVTIGAMAVIVFLSAAFYFYDANKVEGPIPEIQHVENQAGPDDLIATNCTGLFGDSATIIHEVAGWSSHFATASMNFTAVISPDESIMWRYTTNGWQDISLLADQSQPAQPFLEGVHPLVWTAITLLGVLILLVMASSETEVDKLMKKQPVASNQKN